MKLSINAFSRNEGGSFSIYFALTLSLILCAVGIAVESTRMMGVNSKAQDASDRAALAAAVYITRNATSPLSLSSRRKEATQIAQDVIESFKSSENNLTLKPNIQIDNETVTVDLEVKLTPIMMNMFGHKTLDIKTEAVANIGNSIAYDVDVALISDATGSMQLTLDAIQNNMKDFTTDLSKELTARGINSGQVRVKFIFYRDLMIDNHQEWTGPDMTLKAGLENTGPLYGSKFFALPKEKSDMDKYVDFFLADGGGSYRESGLEALSYALADADWGDGQDTVRAIMLWTDASTRPPGDKEELELTPYTDPSLYYWNDTLWEDRIGSHFPPLSKVERQDYMFNTFAKKYSVTSLSDLKAKYSTFHKENAQNLESVKTLSINVLNNCGSVAPCGDWPEIATWPGVNYFLETDVFSASVTYDQIVQQVADTVENQLTAKDISLQR